MMLGDSFIMAAGQKEGSCQPIISTQCFRQVLEQFVRVEETLTHLIEHHGTLNVSELLKILAGGPEVLRVFSRNYIIAVKFAA